MHEHIKFTLRLDKEIERLSDINLVRSASRPREGEVVVRAPKTSVKKEIGDWQPIFGDFEYGTDHSIYAKLLGCRLDDDDCKISNEIDNEAINEAKKRSKRVFIVNEIQLYIQNYDGPVTIGFNQEPVTISSEKITLETKEGDPRFPNRMQFTFNIGLEGLKDKFSDFFMIEKDKFLIIPFGRSSALPINRYPLVVCEGDTLKVQTWFSPLKTDFTRIYTTKEELKSSPFVDELFMERNGEDVVVSHKGYRKLEWIRKEHPRLITEEELENAEKNKTERPDDYRDPEGEMGDFRPCERIYSNFHID